MKIALIVVSFVALAAAIAHAASDYDFEADAVTESSSTLIDAMAARCTNQLDRALANALLNGQLMQRSRGHLEAGRFSRAKANEVRSLIDRLQSIEDKIRNDTVGRQRELIALLLMAPDSEEMLLLQDACPDGF